MKKRNMPKISAVILAVLICVFAGILIGKLKENYDPEIFSENYISVDEVKQELIFTVYSQEEWDEWFEGGKKDYLTGAVLDELLKRLGVSEQIDFSEKRKNAAVSRTEWDQVYAQILAFLDMEQSVKKRNTACAKPYGNGRSDGSGHESGRFLYETAEYIFYGLDVL